MSKDIKFFSHNKALDWEQGVHNNIIADNEGVRILSREKYRVLENIQIDSYHAEKVEDIILRSKNYIYIYMKDHTLWQYTVNSQTLEYFMDLSHEEGNVLIEAGNDTLYFMKYGASVIKCFSTIAKQEIWQINTIHSKKFHPIKMHIDQYNYLYLIYKYEDSKSSDEKKNDSLYICRINPVGSITWIQELESCESGKDYMIDSLATDRFYMDVVNQQITIYDQHRNCLYRINEKKEIRKIESFLDKNYYICTGMTTDIYKNIIMVVKERYKDSTGAYLICMQEDKTMEIYCRIPGKDLRKLTKNLEGNILCPDCEQGIVTVFTIKKEHLFNALTGTIEGTLLSTALDGGEKQMKWHRMTIDADIPEDTFIKVSVFSRDTKEIYINDEEIDLDDYLRDPNISFKQKDTLLQSFWTEEFINVKDVLLHKHRGRFIWYKISLIGNEEDTPTINRIRIFYPMVSFIQYLPEIYQAHPESSDFLIRFLGIFQNMMLDLETEIDNISRYFDPDIVDREFLYWLSSWLGIEDVYLWEEDSLRTLIKNAVYLYKKKGTKEGIEKIVELFTGQKPYIVENHVLNAWKDNSISKKHLEELYGNSPYIFTVILKDENLSQSKYKGLKKIIENNKPAYTEVNIVVLKPFLFLDDHTYLGINSILSQRIPLRLNNYSTVSVSTILAE
ncbi:phage tail protein [Defluviitalea saccharophila]|uniref:Phage tail protein n=1 Tax=Defluviitalea saccharophila TaxID=879970 RepID=A0ABZ2YAV2_9FIRM